MRALFRQQIVCLGTSRLLRRAGLAASPAMARRSAGSSNDGFGGACHHG